MSESVERTVPVASTAALKRRDDVASGVHVLTFDIEGVVPVPVPGQFYQVDCGGGREHLLPRPMGVLDAREQSGGLILSMMIEVVGWGTARLCALEVGQSVRVLGPLGRGFGPLDEGRALIVAGGAGFAPLHYLASTLDKEGREYDLMVGISTRDKYTPAMATLKGGVEIFSDDGTIGVKGLVCDAAASQLSRNGYTKVYTCGPEPMMAVVARACEQRGVPCEVSLDSRMACGIGACRGCVRKGADGSNLCVCTDGPVFDSTQVTFNAPPAPDPGGAS